MDNIKLQVQAENAWSEYWWDFIMKHEDKMIPNEEFQGDDSPWYYISDNKYLTFNIVKNNPKKPWNWYIISRKLATEENIIQNPDLPWVLSELASNKNLSISFLTSDVFQKIVNKNNNENIISFWKHMSQRHDIDINFVIRFQDKINWFYVTVNTAITLKDINANRGLPWVWDKIAGCRRLTSQFIEDNIDKPFEWHNIKLNPIDITFLHKYVAKPFDWESISIDKLLTKEHISMNPNLPWDWYTLSKRDDIGIEFCQQYYSGPYTSDNMKTIDFNIAALNIYKNVFTPKTTIDTNLAEDNKNNKTYWELVSTCDNISVDFIRKHKKNPLLDWEKIKYRKYVTVEFLREFLEYFDEDFIEVGNDSIKLNDMFNNLDIPWNWFGVTYHPDLTMDIINKIPNPHITHKCNNPNFAHIVNKPSNTWNALHIASESFTKEHDDFINKFMAPIK